MGHVNGIDVRKVQAIRGYPMPITRKDLKRFLRLINYYHKFVPKMAEITAPLNEMSGGPIKTNRTTLQLNETHVQPFVRKKIHWRRQQL